MTRHLATCLAVAAAALCFGAGRAARGAAAARSTDKSRFTLFDPTPRDLMRELSTDRPDVTESAFTVDAGHVQVELSFVEYVHDDDGGGDFDELAVLPVNLKLGLTNNTDVQLVVQPYIHQRFSGDGDDDDTADGFGATQVRLKVNLWGNDRQSTQTGDTALAIMPYVQFPTADDDLGGVDHVEGGIIVPFAVALPRDWTLALMGEVDFLRDADDDGYGIGFLHTAALGRPIAGDLDGFIEYVGFAAHDLGVGYVAAAGGGLTYGIDDNTQLDAALSFGISDAADDIAARVGLSFRI